MMYQFAVTGIGLSVGGITGHEDLIEAVLTKKKTDRTRVSPAIGGVLEAALKYKEHGSTLLLTGEEISPELLRSFGIAGQKQLLRFGSMLTEAGRILSAAEAENVLLLAQSEDGFAAVLLSGKSARSFARAEIDLNAGGEQPLMDAMMEFIKAVVEIRYAFRFDGSAKEISHIWHWAEKRESSRSIDGVRVHLQEAPLVHKAVYASRRYLFPVKFDTVAQAEEALRALRSDARKLGLFRTMEQAVRTLKNGKEHTIVLLADSLESLTEQIDELLGRCPHLLDEGFHRWKSGTGSRYIRRTARNPRVVFMNPPGGMFSGKPFLRYVSKLYEFVEEPFRTDGDIHFNRSKNELIHRYMNEINITYAVMHLLKTIGIEPDYLSGASMGEIVFILSNSVFKDSPESGLRKPTALLEAAIRNILEDRKSYEQAYFGHEVDLAKFYLKCDAEKVKQAIGKYRDVFVIIEGSPVDVLICGERGSCRKLIGELECVSAELGDPIYIHTPVVESEHEKIRTGFLDAGMYLDVEKLPYKLFSTYLNTMMDSSCEMFAENLAAILTKPVNYRSAVEALYEQDARVFIDLSTQVSMLPALIALCNRKQAEFGYQQKVRVGAGGGIGTGASCLAAFEMGAAYVVTGSVNQGCVESGTSDYVKQILAQTAMADVTMAPCADMFEVGAKVEVIKKMTMYAQNAQKLYDYYVKYPSFDAIPPADRDRIEKKILKDTFENIWKGTREYFTRVDPGKIPQAEKSPKMKMALVFRWYLGSSSRWAVQGDLSRKFDMQIWCGQSMGAFNLWVKGTPMEQAENRRVGEVAKLLLDSCAYHFMKNLLIRMGAAPGQFRDDIL